MLDALHAELRGMRDDDLQAVVALEAAAYEFPWSPGIFRDCLRSGHECRVLCRAFETIGYGVLSVGAGEAHLLNACVAPSWQGRGYGRRLVEGMIDVARQRCAHDVFLEVRPSNAAARALYGKLGFNEIAMRPSYYPARFGREDAIVMAMALLPPESR